MVLGLHYLRKFLNRFVAMYDRAFVEMFITTGMNIGTYFEGSYWLQEIADILKVCYWAVGKVN